MSLGAPKPPDPTQTANTQQGYNVQAANQQQQTNMIGQNGPFASLQYVQSGTNADGSPKYTAQTSLSDPAQALLNQQYGIQGGLGGMFGNLAGGVNSLGSTLNPSNLNQDAAASSGTTAGLLSYMPQLSSAALSGAYGQLGQAANNTNMLARQSDAMVNPNQVNQNLGTATGATGAAGNTLAGLMQTYQNPGSVDPSARTNQMVGNMLAYNKPLWDMQQSNLDAQLRNQGIAPGTEAYNNAQALQARTENEATTNAVNQYEPTAYNQAMSNYMLPMTTGQGLINAAGSVGGQGVSAAGAGVNAMNPAFQAAGQQGNLSGMYASLPGQAFSPTMQAAGLGQSQIGADVNAMQPGMGAWNSVMGNLSSMPGQGMPSNYGFTNTPTANVQPANYQQAAQNQYQALQQQNAGMWSGIGSAGGALASVGLAPFTGGASLAALPGMFSGMSSGFGGGTSGGTASPSYGASYNPTAFNNWWNGSAGSPTGGVTSGNSGYSGSSN